MEKNIKVTIVEDHDMTRMGLSFALSNSGIIDVVGTSADGQEGVEQALELRPDLNKMLDYNKKKWHLYTTLFF